MLPHRRRIVHIYLLVAIIPLFVLEAIAGWVTPGNGQLTVMQALGGLFALGLLSIFGFAVLVSIGLEQADSNVWWIRTAVSSPIAVSGIAVFAVDTDFTLLTAMYWFVLTTYVVAAVYVLMRQRGQSGD